MKAYGYVAYTGTGKRRKGTVVAETETAAAEQLRKKGLFVAEMSGRAGQAGRSRGFGFRQRLNADLQAVFTRQIAVLLAAGLPAEAALEAVRASGADPVVDGVSARARAALLQGSPLSEALETSGAGFPPYYTAAIGAGERAGDLATVFEELATHLETAGADRSRISTALIYPAFVAAVSLLVCAILLINVAPEIVAMFEMANRPLPDLTLAVLAVSDWIRDHAIALGIVATALLGLLIASGRVPGLRARRDRLLLRLPIAGRLMRQGAAVQYLRTLALLLGSRHAVLDSVESAAGVLTVRQFRDQAREAPEAVRRGESLALALDRLSFIPPVARQLIGAGETSSRLAPMTGRAAVLVENSLSTERKRIATLLEPVLMMMVGGFVLLIVLSVLLPIFDLQAVVTG